MGGKLWTAEEDALLRELWAKQGTLKMHAKRFKNKSSNSLHLRGKRLGLPDRMELSTDRYSLTREKVAEAFENGFTGTVNEMAALTGECTREVLRRVTEGHGTKYRICDWVRKKTFSNWTAVYTLGSEPDAPRPVTQTMRERRKRHREKRKIVEGRINPFAVLVSQVTAPEMVAMEPKQGAYRVRVFREAA